ncbi:hypothetical protein HYC85_019253 [Camellia sinensis]|uniref:Uncharacterized protein n=1 Tax=Camellia sinensis TaxID=4442 RepID=A0A7J7GNW9_CAMSI|nr:hypothetical protein HYC85_019253 [Camellia sinensis]
MARQADLQKIGREGFALVEEFFGTRNRKKPHPPPPPYQEPPQYQQAAQTFSSPMVHYPSKDPIMVQYPSKDPIMVQYQSKDPIMVQYPSKDPIICRYRGGQAHAMVVTTKTTHHKVFLTRIQ